jgi:hypothetical protein
VKSCSNSSQKYPIPPRNHMRHNRGSQTEDEVTVRFRNTQRYQGSTKEVVAFSWSSPRWSLSGNQVHTGRWGSILNHRVKSSEKPWGTRRSQWDSGRISHVREQAEAVFKQQSKKLLIHEESKMRFLSIRNHKEFQLIHQGSQMSQSTWCTRRVVSRLWFWGCGCGRLIANVESLTKFEVGEGWSTGS